MLARGARGRRVGAGATESVAAACWLCRLRPPRPLPPRRRRRGFTGDAAPAPFSIGAAVRAITGAGRVSPIFGFRRTTASAAGAAPERSAVAPAGDPAAANGSPTPLGSVWVSDMEKFPSSGARWHGARAAPLGRSRADGRTPNRWFGQEAAKRDEGAALTRAESQQPSVGLRDAVRRATPPDRQRLRPRPGTRRSGAIVPGSSANILVECIPTSCRLRATAVAIQ